MRVAKPEQQKTLRKTVRASSAWRFLLVFAACFLLGFAVLVTPNMKQATVTFSRALVSASASLITVFGGTAKVEGETGTILRHPSHGLAVEMKDGCNGVNVTILLWSAVLAFPASWIHKAKGLLLGGVAIQSINILRFISLFYLLQYNRPLFDFAHDYLWESLVMLDALVVFWLWVHQVFRSYPIQSVSN
jgi:exosortase H (IPTLxxWG-CTERM-specific)